MTDCLLGWLIQREVPREQVANLTPSSCRIS
jgi:hypothetical protein